MHVKTKELPKSVQSLLKRVGYHKHDISIEATETVSPGSAGGAGLRYYFAALNLATGKSDVTYGSWGGANMFNPQNQVDLDNQEYRIPENGLVVKGCEGAYSYATIYVAPMNVQQFLPAPVDITDKERAILNAFATLKSGPYRAETLARIGATDADFAGLVDKKLLKQNKCR